jgi:hypothetical protein
VRLRCRTAEELAADIAQVEAAGAVPLHFTADQSGGVAPRERAYP